jgi:hypothetical protein
VVLLFPNHTETKKLYQDKTRSLHMLDTMLVYKKGKRPFFGLGVIDPDILSRILEEVALKRCLALNYYQGDYLTLWVGVAHKGLIGDRREDASPILIPVPPSIRTYESHKWTGLK